ncbi:uncharacterized protein YALI1_E19883g [Yarrowia lipolytica]|uniref:NFACT RNA-binding domain-containing protein n=1 Tax=Yarrowia lipolytica TaxID=4952 RepID=A0A1D8NIP8_YARLL|nr:hypothetical protein YALI1_E19883g [Yarrowia lipolytica]QNP99016.1 Coiled-coil domain-containing protein 25 [Yarrowia lipolytica]
MVYYYESQVVDPYTTLYMGKDKFENENLIKNGWLEDVWFHVDNLSSAHVYLRIPEGADWTFETLPAQVVQDCAQLTKANSIEGNKKDNVTVIYTPHSNLKKTKGMATGQVGFHKDTLVRKVHLKTRENGIINRLNKTKREEYPDLEKQKTIHESKTLKEAKEARMERERAEKALEEERAAERYRKKHAYDDFFSEENMQSSETTGNIEDDFW